MKIEELYVWEAFQAVAVQGSFSKAAVSLRISVSQLSKRVAKLEDQLGVRLFLRSTRKVSLTDEGRSLLPKVNSVLDDLSGLESSFEHKTSLSGTIRITSVPFVAQRLLLPVITEFKKRHSQVEIELELSEGLVNLVESNIDLALRIHDEPSDSSLVYRKLAPNQLIFCASPQYLKKSGKPLLKPNDLKFHSMLALSIHGDCRFRDGSHRLRDLVKVRALSCENGWFLTEAALKNLGVLIRSGRDVKDYLKSGALVQVLSQYPLEDFGNIYAVIPSRKYLAPRVRSFLDLLVNYSVRWNVNA